MHLEGEMVQQVEREVVEMMLVVEEVVDIVMEQLRWYPLNLVEAQERQK